MLKLPDVVWSVFLGMSTSPGPDVDLKKGPTGHLTAQPPWCSEDFESAR